MSTRETSAEIDGAAAGWVARMDRAPLSAAEQGELEQWLKADSRRRGAFARAEAVFNLAGRACGDATAPAAISPVHVSRRHLLWGGAGVTAAAVAAAAAAIILPTLGAEQFHTRRGELRSIPLSDGSLVTLNTESEIEVRLTRKAREVRLLRGEVQFDVAKDSARPFIVTTGFTAVRAVGTSFSVRGLKDQPVEVLVSEGAVDMFKVDAEAQPLRVPTNFRAVSREGPSPSVALIEPAMSVAAVARQLAWRQGYLSFEGETLGYAAAEFNRYNDLQIVVDDPAAAARTIVGRFSVHNPFQFAQQVALGFGLQIGVRSNNILLWQ
jgi:transmembrane sensor